MFRGRSLATLALVSMLISAVGCGSKNPNAPSLRNGSMTATIAGASFAATVTLTATFDGKILSIGGTDLATTLAFAVANQTNTALTAGTYVIGPLSPTNSLLQITSGGVTTGFAANLATGSGTVTITSLTTTGASGTFSFTEVQTGGTATRSVTNGVFNVTF